MNTRSIFWISAALNLALAGGVLWKVTHSPAAATKSHALHQPAAPPTNAEAHPSPIARTQSWPPFLWSQIASEDLKVYRDNLRAVGCPELTVREIILSEINERFGRRRRNMLVTLENRFWDFALRGEFVERRRRPVAPEWQQPLEALVAERLKVINQVLGKDYASVDAAEHERLESLERRLAWLPAEKRAQLIALETEQAQKFAEWAQAAGSRDQGSAAEEDARFRKLQQDFEDAQNKLLTPEELKELRLRDSNVGEWAGSMPGFDPAEDEWRSMTEARFAYEEAQRNMAGPGLSDEERIKIREEADAKFQEQIKTALGEDRFAEYQRASNDQFQDVRNVTERYGLPEEVAVQAFEIQQAALAYAKQVREDPSLSPDDRQSALNALQQETERTLNEKLGQKAFSTYKDYSGSWLRGLTGAAD